MPASRSTFRPARPTWWRRSRPSSPRRAPASGIPADLSTEAECRRLADELASREDALDILVNNAGATWGAPLADFDEAAFERVLALNVKGVFHLTKFLVPLLQKAGRWTSRHASSTSGRSTA